MIRGQHGTMTKSPSMLVTLDWKKGKFFSFCTGC